MLAHGLPRSWHMASRSRGSVQPNHAHDCVRSVGEAGGLDHKRAGRKILPELELRLHLVSQKIFIAKSKNLKSLHLFRKVILAAAFSKDVGRRTVQTTAEWIGVSKRHRHDFKTEFIKLFHLMDFAGFDTNGFRI